MQTILERLNILIGRLKQMIVVGNLMTPQGQKIFDTAKACLGNDASPNDLAPDELGCAETVSNVLIRAGYPIPIILSTAKLYEKLRDDRSWVSAPNPLPGDVILSPTGMGNGKLSNGHTGIVGVNGVVMSNSSATGTFETNYTLTSWNKRYSQLGGFPVFYFRRVL